MSKGHVDELAAKVGEELAVTEWVTVDQERIDRFADAIDDHQWIHVDTERAAGGPFGTTIAHGYLTLSLLSIFLEPLLDLDGLSMRVNYGIEKVRFPHPVPVDSRLRARVTLASAEETEQGLLVAVDCVLEIDGVEKPACVARPLALLIRPSL